MSFCIFADSASLDRRCSRGRDDYRQFDRFLKLTPRLVYSIDGRAELLKPPGYAPSRDESEFCRQFVITAALRVAEAEAHAVPPSWTTAEP